MKLNTWKEADEALRNLGEAQMAKELHEAKLTAAVNRLKSKTAAEVSPLDQEVGRIEAALERFWREYRKDVDAKSRKLVFGTLGERFSARVKLARGWKVADVIAALKKHGGFSRLIRTREDLRKPEIQAAWPGKDLEACGITVKGGDKFFAEPDRVAILAPPKEAA